MRLGDVLCLKPSESKVAIWQSLNEDPLGAPKWNFDYGNAQHDPSPEALILGTYQHPTSGNELVGGINLNYLNPQQIQQLQKELPRIMRGSDLKQRYDIGARLLPQIFNNFYRTYKSDLVQGVKPAELPYWQDKKVRAAKVQKTKRQKDMERQAAAQRQAELRRQSLQAMQQPAPPMPQRPPTGAPQMPGQRPGPRPMPQRPGPGRMPAAPDSLDALQAQQQQGEMELQRLADMQRERAAQLSAVKQRHDAAKAKQDAQRKLDRERQKNLQQLQQPNPDAAAEGDPLAVDESITYWSPSLGRYVTEWVGF